MNLVRTAPGCFRMNEVQGFEILAVWLVLMYVPSR